MKTKSRKKFQKNQIKSIVKFLKIEKKNLIFFFDSKQFKHKLKQQQILIDIS